MQNQKQLEFFLIVCPGLENLALQEIEHKSHLLFGDNCPQSIQLEYGGITFHAPLEQAVLFNHYLKIPTRILIRLKTFKCRDTPKLFNIVKKIEWRLWLKGQIPQIKVSSHQSRLFNSKKIEMTVIQAIENYYHSYPPKKKDLEASSQVASSLYIRLENDLCTISLDTSGAPLFQNSVRPLVGVAPLRETMASACVLALVNQLSTREEITLLDPMCGSGTLLYCAATFWQPSKRHDYAYNQFPTLKNFKLKQLRPLKYTGSWPKNFRGFESNAQTVATIRNVLQELNIQIEHHDVFGLDKDPIKGPMAIISNPPYGERIEQRILGKKLPPNEYYKQLIKHLKTKLGPERIGLIIPSRHKLAKAQSDLKFSNGGLECNFGIF